MSYIRNFLLNVLKRKNFFVTIKKIFRKFEKNNSIEAKKWAKLNTKYDTEKLCRSIDTLLFDEILIDVQAMEKYAKDKISKLKVTLGGGGNYILLYFLIRKFKLTNVVETGVAAGWSSLAILRAFKKNGMGNLYSSDFPYYRLEKPEQYIGILAKNEDNISNWYLDIEGDDKALPEILKRIGENNIDLIHYDSDKTYNARNKALKILYPKINFQTIIIFDDIQDNLHFKDLVEKTKEKFCVLEFQDKYIGIIGSELFFDNLIQ